MIRTTPGGRHALAFAFLATSLAACAPRVASPSPREPLGAPIEAVDPAPLLGDVAVLAADSMEGRRAGSPGGAMARAYLESRIRALGLQPDSQPFTFEGRDSATVQGVNLVVRIPGTSPAARAIVVTAHYDHVGVRNGEVYNGADDNASGTAALLAIAAALRDRPLRHTAILVWLDAEEMGLRGARAFLDSPPLPVDSIALNVNLDMVSRSDAGELHVAGTHHYPALLPVIERVAARAPVTLIPGHDRPGTGRDDWTMQSDHGVFHQASIPFLYFGVEDHPDYHRPTDDFGNIDSDFFVAAVETVLLALREVDVGM